MGVGQSLQHSRGREAPASALSRVRGTQGDAKTSNSHVTLFSDVTPQPHRNIIGYTSRLMRETIGEAYSFDFFVLRRDDSGKVSRVTCRRGGRKAEALVVPKQLNNPVQLQTLKKEIEIWLSLDHPNIARLLEVFEDDTTVYLVSESCPGGSLYDYLAALHKCPEEVARAWVFQMTRALGFLQGYGIVHRNLRLESWQLTTGGPCPSLKLYGLSHATNWHKKEGRLNAACGLLAYTSPDILLGRYTDACDMWSLGVITYQLLCGRPPFVGSQQEIIRQILSGAVNVQHLEKEGVSEEAKSFVLELLTISPHSRLTPQRALEHPWLFSQLLDRQPFPANCTTGLLWFAHSSALRRAALLTCAYCLNSDEIEIAGKLFAATAHSSSGCLTMEDLRRCLQREQTEPLVQEEIEDIFDAMDINKDGAITFTVFVAAMIGTLVEPDEALLQKAFAKLDIDGDGLLSYADCRWAFGDCLLGQSLSEALAEEGSETRSLDYSHFAKMIREHRQPPDHRFPRPPTVADALSPTQQTSRRFRRRRSSARRSSVATDTTFGLKSSMSQRKHWQQPEGAVSSQENAADGEKPSRGA